MKNHARDLMEQQLEQSEKTKTCIVAHSRAERARLRRAARSGLIDEVAPSVFARPSYWTQLKPSVRACHVMRALQELHPDWIFAGPSAATARGLAVSNRYLDKTWLATTRKSHRSDSQFFRTIVVTDDAVECVDGMRLTSLARTVADCLRVMDFRSALAIADSALRVGHLDQDALIQGIEDACARMPNISEVRHIVKLADARAESGGESIARATMLELGIAPPDLQRPFDNPVVPTEPYRVDFTWEVVGGCVLGELDGFEKYVNAEMTRGRSMASVIDDEHRRQSHLEANACVLRVVRFGFADVMRDREFLALLQACGVPRTFAADHLVQKAGGKLRCR